MMDCLLWENNISKKVSEEGRDNHGKTNDFV